MPNYHRTLLEQLNSLPPFAVFSLARSTHGKRPRLEDLAKASGIPERTFVRIARRFTWNNVKAAHIDAFCRACGVDILRQRSQRHFLRITLGYKRPMTHLSERQLKVFERQCREWNQMQMQAAISALPEPQSQSAERTIPLPPQDLHTDLAPEIHNT